MSNVLMFDHVFSYLGHVLPEVDHGWRKEFAVLLATGQGTNSHERCQRGIVNGHVDNGAACRGIVDIFRGIVRAGARHMGQHIDGDGRLGGLVVDLDREILVVRFIGDHAVERNGIAIGVLVVRIAHVRQAQQLLVLILVAAAQLQVVPLVFHLRGAQRKNAILDLGRQTIQKGTQILARRQRLDVHRGLAIPEIAGNGLDFLTLLVVLLLLGRRRGVHVVNGDQTVEGRQRLGLEKRKGFDVAHAEHVRGIFHFHVVFLGLFALGLVLCLRGRTRARTGARTGFRRLLLALLALLLAIFLLGFLLSLLALLLLVLALGIGALLLLVILFLLGAERNADHQMILIKELTIGLVLWRHQANDLDADALAHLLLAHLLALLRLARVLHVTDLNDNATGVDLGRALAAEDFRGQRRHHLALLRHALAQFLRTLLADPLG